MEPLTPNTQQSQPSKNLFITSAEHYASILRYFLPEFLVAFVLYTIVGIIDAQCIAHLKSTSCYASLGIANTLTLFINKLAEGISVGAVIMCGQYQGQKNYEMVGKSMVAALWATAFIGGSLALFFYYDSHLICHALRIPDAVAADCIPYLRLRAVGIAFMFLFSALVGFLRGVKNTRAVMYFFLLGIGSFIFFDYALIFGMFGFPAYGFQGSAAAFALQYIIMFCAALVYIICNKDYKIYNINFMHSSWSLLKSIFSYSWPVTFDKAALQIERLWMVRVVAPMGSVALGSLNVIKDMEALAFVPAIAFGQVVTLLTSNEFGAQQYEKVKQTTKSIVALASLMVGILAVLFIINAQTVIGFFDRQQTFTYFAVQVFPVTVLLLGFDLLQLILAGALRGVGNVKVVMWARVASALVLFMPITYTISLLPLENPVLKFIMIYGTFNVVNGLTSMLYIYWFKSGSWLASSTKLQQS